MRIAVFGANGRVGCKVIEILESKKITTIPVDIDTDTDDIYCDGVIDFSRPQALANITKVCLNNNAPLVIGTTGYNAEQLEQLELLGKSVIVDYRKNFSIGIAALKEVILVATPILKDFDCEIVETHHKKKVDSPSGTALDIASLLTAAKSNSHITIHSLRGGTVFGTHSVVFMGNGETFTITHNAENVDVFAKGAVAAMLDILNR